MRLLFLVVFLLGACASPSRPPPLGPGEIPSAADARDALADKKTRADVRAILGEPAAAIPFDSGYEVWVYRQQLREKQEPPRGELVLLFDRSGLLAKSRIKMTPWPNPR